MQSALPADCRYKSPLDAARRIVAQEGVRGLYRGYSAQIASFGPYSAVWATAFEQFKRVAAKQLPSRPSAGSSACVAAELPLYAKALCGASAATFASILLCPLDVAKLRLQVRCISFSQFLPCQQLHRCSRQIDRRQQQGATRKQSYNYRGMFDALSKIWQYEGPGKLWRGESPRHLISSLSLRVCAGAMARAAFHAPASAVTIASLEFGKQQVLRLKS